MGRLIDIDEARKEYSNLTDLTMSDTTLLLTLFGVLDNAPTVEAIPKAEYENRLKADMVAILEELDFRLSNYQDTDLIRQDIQEKINSLKEVKDGSN